MTLDTVNTLVQHISAWPGVRVEAHRFGGVEFKFGAVEIGHVHRGGMVDIPFTRKLRAQLVAAGEAEPHHLLPETGWVSFYVRKEGDLDNALRLFRLSYLQKTRRRALLDEPLAAALSRLNFAPAVNAIIQGADNPASD